MNAMTPRRKRGKKAVTLSVMPTQWDAGAMGQANRINLREEAATDIDPETGKEKPNPNGIKRQRREAWVRIYARQGKLTDAQVAAAERLRLAAEGMRERDPLAAIGEVRSRGGDAAAARIDARRAFRHMWSHIPLSSRYVVERVAIDDLPLNGNSVQRIRHMQRLCDGLDAVP